MINVEDLVNKKIATPGGDCVIALDYIAAEPKGSDSLLLESASDARQSIWMEEEVLITLRREYPDVPVFGLWQMLCHNEQIDDVVSLQILYGHSKHDGYYVLVEYGRITNTGQYMGGLFPQRADLHMEDAMAIDFVPEKWQLPNKPGLLFSELRQHREKLQKRVTGVAVAGCIAIALLAVAVDLTLSALFKSELAAFDEKKQYVRTLEDDIARLRGMRLARWPEQQGYLKPFVYLNTLDPTLAVKESALKSSAGKAILHMQTNPALFFPWIKSKHLQNGDWQVQWPAPLKEVINTGKNG